MGVGKFSRFSTVFAILLTLGFSLMAGVMAHAQVTGATVSGTVTDPSGGVVAGATVSATNTATAATRDVTTDASGLYTIPNLAPGSYELKVSATGFSTSLQSGLTLTVGQQLQLNFSLKVGNTTTTVQVTEAAPQIDLTSSALTGQVESETVRELPLNGRDWTSLAQLQPGVKQIQTQMAFATSARGNRGFGGEMTISGQRSTFNNYRIDGISVNDYAMAAPGNVIGIVLGVDAIQEFSVLTSGFPAEYGRATGGVVNSISRSGTNQFHGAVYEFLRNSALDARPYFNRVTDTANPPFKRNTFGASAGGPILKDRLFIFGDYEGLRQNKGITSNSTVFSDAARLGIVAANPAPAGGHPAGTACTDLGGSPGHFLSPLANTCVNDFSAALLNLWPHANGPANANSDLGSFIFSGSQTAPENFGTARVDYKIGNNDSIFGTFLRDQATYNQPDALNDVIQQSTTSRTTIAIEENHTFSSSFVNAARVGFNRDNVRNSFSPTAVNPAAADPALAGILGQTAPRLSVGNGIDATSGGTNSGSHYLHTWNSYQYADDAFWTHGAHTIKFGVSVERMLYNEHTFQNPGGRYIFNNGAAFGSRPLQFLSGEPSHYEAGLANIVDNPREFRQTSMGFYAQDDWKIKSNLTLNLGLRYEPTTVLKDGQGRITNLASITATSPTCGVQFSAPVPTPQPGSACGGVGPYYKNPTLRNFEPRVGFAWDPFKDGKSSVRGSFGLYDVDPFAGYFLLQQNQAAPFTIFKSMNGFSNFPVCTPTNPACTSTTTYTGPFQPQEGGFQLANSTSSKLAMSTIEGAPHRSYVEQWNLSVQRQLTSDMSLTVGYVGSHGVHLLMRGDDGNMSGAPIGSAEPAVKTPYGYLFPCGPVGAGANCTPGVTQANGSAVANPLLGVVRYIFWNTDSNYHGLNVNLDKKFAHGFQFQVAYTYSKSQDDDSQTIAGDTFANGINSPIWWLPRVYYGPSDFNVAHTLSINGLYTIPTPKSWSGAMKEALADWELGGIYSFNSGTPTTVTNSGDPLGLNNGGADPYGPLVPLAGCNPINYQVGGPTVSFLNQTCFTEPSLPTSAVNGLPYGCAGFPNAGKTVGKTTFIPLAPTGQTYCENLLPFNVGRNTINGPHFSSLDFSVHKVFPVTKISEQFNIQFRAEIFDIFNHSNFNPPQPNSGADGGLSGLINPDGSYTGAGNITLPANLQTPAREIQFALKVNW
jgi:Carboxypeptidase regulatory-like domain/TonB-dependent Receptor Plug Domain/TonB dependent receptor